MKNKHSLDNSTLLEMFQSQDRGTGDHMEENRQKVIAMAMKICIESSDDDSDDSDTDLYRIAKKPKMAASNNDIEAMPASDLNLIRRFSVELLPDQQNFLRLDDLTFEKLLTLVQSSQYSDPIAGAKQTLTVRERLVLTLSYLATGRNYNELVFSSPKTAQIINQIILETCDLLYKALRGEYMKVPQSEADWKQIAQNFEHKWQFNKCLGIVGGKNVMISLGAPAEALPPGADSNANSYSNAILMAIINDNFQFIYVNVSDKSRSNDSGIWQASDFNSCLQNNSLHIPTDYNVNGSKCQLPYVFLGDKSFPLRNNLLRPFASRIPPYDERIFNYRLARARRVFDNTFNVLTNRFQCFHRPIALDSDRVDSIILAACTLHNFLLHSCQNYIDLMSLDYEDTENGTVVHGTRVESAALLDLTLTTTSTTNIGKTVREEYKKFFNGVGKTSFQDRMIQHFTS